VASSIGRVFPESLALTTLLFWGAEIAEWRLEFTGQPGRRMGDIPNGTAPQLPVGGPQRTSQVGRSEVLGQLSVKQNCVLCAPQVA
jgi:hypothetical protein